jgi:hypothetical protein
MLERLKESEFVADTIYWTVMVLISPALLVWWVLVWPFTKDKAPPNRNGGGVMQCDMMDIRSADVFARDIAPSKDVLTQAVDDMQNIPEEKAKEGLPFFARIVCLGLVSLSSIVWYPAWLTTATGILCCDCGHKVYRAFIWPFTEDPVV